MEKDIGKIKKNDFTDVIIRLDDFGGRPGVTIREFVTGDRYTGFTKSGVKIPAADFARFKEMINSVDEKDLEAPSEGEKSEKQGKMPPQKGQKTLSEPEEDSSKEDENDFDDY